MGGVVGVGTAVWVGRASKVASTTARIVADTSLVADIAAATVASIFGVAAIATVGSTTEA